MGFQVESSVPVLTVFIQGLISFFSPCVLPLVPLYVSYLAGGARVVDKEGNSSYPRKKVLLNTLFFVVGVSFAFFLLGFGFTALGMFFKDNRLWFARISGIVMILFGLYQLGVFGKSEALTKEHRLPFKLDRLTMGPVAALVLGFTFSFAWTPCVGPTLGSVLLMAGSTGSAAKGFLLIGVYTLGFVLPFLAVGLFTGTVLDFFKKHTSVVKYTVKAGAALLILMGVMTLTGFMNGMTNYLSGFGGAGGGSAKQERQETGESQTGTEAAGGDSTAEAGNGGQGTDGGAGGANNAGGTGDSQQTKGEGTEQDGAEGADSSLPGSGAATDGAGSGTAGNAQAGGAENGAAGNAQSDGAGSGAASGDGSEQQELLPAVDFTLTDQYGVEHKMSDYKGKTVFLNFWATWCPPCKGEMPEIQSLYEAYGENQEDLVVLGVAAPNYGQEGDADYIKDFLEENGYTFPVVMDEDAELFYQYGITAFPTTFMVDTDGNVFGYAQGALTGDMMESIVQQTMTGVRTP